MVGSVGTPSVIVLDEGLKPIRCFSGTGLPTPCEGALPTLGGEESIVVGGAAAEALASELGATYLDERLVRLVEGFRPGSAASLYEAALEALGRRSESPLLAGTMLVVLPGSSARAWATGIAAELKEGRAILRSMFHFSDRLVTRFRYGEDWEPLSRFGSWWLVPWHVVFSLGKNLRRALEVITERPVERLRGSHLEKASTPEELVEEAARLASSLYSSLLGRRSPRRVVVYIDEELFKPQGGYTAVVVSKNYQRRVVARWYFNRRFELVGFDAMPPEAVSGVDAEIAVGDVPREVQARLTGAGAVLVARAAVLAPVRVEDYVAIKAVRWYENAAI